MGTLSASWRTCTVAGRRVEVFEPDTRPEYAVLWLHDIAGGSFRGDAVIEHAFAAEQLLVLCPSGGAGWWLDWPTPEFPAPRSPVKFLLEELLPNIESQWGLAPPRIGLTGVGMGGQGAVNLAFRHARRFPVVAALLPDIDFHQWYGRGLPLDVLFESQEAARQHTATLHLHPLNWPRHLFLACDPLDPRFEGTERLASKLVSSGVPFDRDFQTTTSGDPQAYVHQLIPEVSCRIARQLRSLNTLHTGD